MKTLGKYLMLLTAFCALSVTSCVNDDLAERQNLGAGKIATLEDQAAAIEASVADIEALQTALGEGRDAGLEKSASALEDHVADLRAKAPFMDATMTTLALQKKLAEAVGAVLASDSNGDLAKHAATLEKGVKTWLGKHLTAYYPAALAQARTASAIASLDLKTRKLNVEAILSDVEAGLSAYEDVEGLSALAEKVNGNCETAASLAAELSALTEEVEAEYTKAVETVVSDPENFDAPAIKQFNAGVQTKAGEADNTLAGLISRVEACEAQLEDIKTRLEDLESKVDNLEELLGMIQSVTFMSEYSEEKAIAYYTLGSESRDDGKKVRNHQGTIDLRYVIRPASAAQALTASDLWDDEVKVFGYYANTITKAALETFNFDITNVTADESGNGIVTVTVSAESLGESFYFKETGAKLALSIATGKTDLTSKFVEIVPKDKSGAVYVESIELSAKSIEIDNGTKADLDAFITPNNVTVGGVIWTTSKVDVLTVTESGEIEGKSVGSAVITATTKGTDEWGNKISAQCTVKVNPSIKIIGSDSVEEGGTAEIRIQSPNYIDPKYVKWAIGTFTSKNAAGEPTGFNTNQTYASIDETGKVKGLQMYYDIVNKEYGRLMVRCTIEGATPIVLYHEMRVVAIQPIGISIGNLSDTDTQVTTKVNNGISLYGTIKPETVNGSLFKVAYIGTGVNFDNGGFSASSVGTHNVTVQVVPMTQYDYFYPKGKGLARNIIVTVEPYWVTEVTLNAPQTIDVGTESKITATLTSDVGGVTPTHNTLIWESLNPEVASVDGNGNLKGLSEGTATIKVTTSDGATENGNPIEKTCSITVLKPSAPMEVGDYYYSDGTWGSDANPQGKTVVGVIFAKVNAYSQDSHLQADGKTDCIHGLAVGLNEVSNVQFATNSMASTKTPKNWLVNNGYHVTDYETICGYGNTKGLSSNGEGFSNLGISVHNSLSSYNTEAPNISSGWYVPSFREMQLLFESMSTINSSFESLQSATALTTGYYWHSSYYYNTQFDSCAISPFNMSTGDWLKNTMGTVTNSYLAYPVRVVLAF